MEGNQSLGSLRAPSKELVLIVDDEKDVVGAIEKILHFAEYRTSVAHNVQQGLSIFEQQQPDIVLVDLRLPGDSGISLIKQLRQEFSQCVIVCMSAHGGADIALEAIQVGASDFLQKPFDAEQLLLTIRKAGERERLRKENELLKEQVSRRYSFNNIIAKSPSMMDIFDVVKKISDYNTTVMIHGESGTGKELVARAIHYNSPRRNKRFIGINCGAIPENLLESELFGHRRGSFTDATRDKKGLFEEASGGTVLLDEIGELPVHLQVKLLRVLQERVIQPIGASKPVEIDTRVIAATLRDLEKDCADGRFRDDLYYRLNVISLRIPALRERKEDIPLLVNHFIKKSQEKLGLTVAGVTQEALARLLSYSWPGNVRELENCIERAMILTEDSKITIDSLSPAVRRGSDDAPGDTSSSPQTLSIKDRVRALEEHLIREALKKTEGNRTHAAKHLEISHRTLLYKIKEFNLSDFDGKS